MLYISGAFIYIPGQRGHKCCFEENTYKKSRKAKKQATMTKCQRHLGELEPSWNQGFRVESESAQIHQPLRDGFSVYCIHLSCVLYKHSTLCSAHSDRAKKMLVVFFFKDKVLRADLKENVKIYNLKCRASHVSLWFIFKRWIAEKVWLSSHTGNCHNSKRYIWKFKIYH